MTSNYKLLVNPALDTVVLNLAIRNVIEDDLGDFKLIISHLGEVLTRYECWRTVCVTLQTFSSTNYFIKGAFDDYPSEPM
jgi:hypothetical protein